MSDIDHEDRRASERVYVEIEPTVPSGKAGVFNALVDQFAAYTEDVSGGGFHDMSDDAFLQQLRDASRLLEEHDIPRDDRAPYVTAAIRAGAFRNMDRELSEIDHHVHMAFRI